MVATSSGLPYYRYIRIPGQERYVQASVVKKDEVHNGLFVLVDVLLGPAASSLLGDKVSHHEINGYHYLGAWIPANFKSVWRLTDETVPGGPEKVLKSLSPPLEAGDLPDGIEVPELKDTLHMAEAVVQTADNDLDGTVSHQPATTQASVGPARAAAVQDNPVSHVQGPQASGPTSQESAQLADLGSAAAVVDGAAMREQGFGSHQLAANGQVPSAIGQSTLGLAPMPNGIPAFASTFSAPYRQAPSPAVSIVPSQSGYPIPYGQAPGVAFPDLNQNGIMVRPPAQVQGPYPFLPSTPFLGCGYPTNMGYVNNLYPSIAPSYTLGQPGGLHSCNPSSPGLHPGQPPVGVPSGVPHYNSLPGAGMANEKCLSTQEVRNIQKQANGTPLIMGGPYRGAEDARPLILVRSRIQENISAYAGDEVFAYYYIRRSIEADIIEGFSLPHPTPYRSSYAYLVGLLWSSLEGKMDPDAELSKVMDDWNGLTMSQGEDFSKFLKRFEAGLRSLSAVGNPMTPELAKQSLLTKVVPALRDFARTFQLDSYQRLTCRMLLEDRQRRRKLAVSGRGRQEDDRGMILTVEDDQDGSTVAQFSNGKLSCRRCSRPNHMARECRQPVPENQQRRCPRCGRRHPLSNCDVPVDIVCQRCRESGHTAGICPHPWKDEFGKPRLLSSSPPTAKNDKPQEKGGPDLNTGGIQQLAFDIEDDCATLAPTSTCQLSTTPLGCTASEYKKSPSSDRYQFSVFIHSRSTSSSSSSTPTSCLLEGLLDTGAGHSCISTAKYEELSAGGFIAAAITCSGRHIRGVNGSIAAVERVVEAWLSHASVPETARRYRFYVVASLARPVIFSPVVLHGEASDSNAFSSIMRFSTDGAQVAADLPLSASTFARLVGICRQEGEQALLNLLDRAASSHQEGLRPSPFKIEDSAYHEQHHSTTTPSVTPTTASPPTHYFHVDYDDIDSDDILELNACWPSDSPAGDWLPLDYHLQHDEKGRLIAVTADGVHRGYHELPWAGSARPRPNAIKEFAKNKRLCLKLDQKGVLDDYTAIIEDMVRDNYLYKVSVQELVNRKAHCIFHFPIFKPNSRSSKIRPVWDGRELNACLRSLPIPDKHKHTIRHLFRTRLYPSFFCTDIQKAFLQLILSGQDRPHCCFVHNSYGYVMRRVWFGGSSAPWALQDEIDHTLLDVNSQYPTDEAEVEAYMDDVIGGAQTNEGRDELHSTSSAALKVKGMQENPVKVLKNGQDGRVLGYDYEGSNDTIAVASSSPLSTTPCPTTRRELRSFVARFHDPMGLQCEALMCIKYVLQDAESSCRNENDLLKEYDETSSDTKPLTYRVHEWQCHLRSSAPFPRQVKWDFSGQTIFVSTDACVRGWAVIVETDTCGTRLFGRCGVFGPTERRSSKWTAPRAELCALFQGFVTVKTLIKQVSGVARCLILTDSRLNYHRLTRKKPKNGWVAWEVTRLRSIVALNDDIQSSGVCLYVSHIPGTLNSADAASRGLFPPPASNVLSNDVTSIPLKQQKQHYLEKALTEIDEQPVAGNAGIIDPRRVSLLLPQDYVPMSPVKARGKGKYDSNGDGVGNYMLPEEESCLYEILDTPTEEGCILTSTLTASDGSAPAKAQFGQAFDSLLSRLFRYRLLSDVFVLWRQATESAASSVIVRPARFDILELLVRDAQREDSETTCILQAVRRGDTTLSPFYDVESDPDLLVRLCRHSVNGEVYRQLYVPSKSWALQRLLVMRYHSCGGHQGSVRTKARLASRFFFRRMGCLVSRVVRSCRVCAPLKDERRRSGYGIKSLDSLDVWTCVAADGVGPLRVPVRDDGTESDLKLMVVTDLVSGYVDAEIVDGFTARESAESLLSVFWRRGYPRLLLVDNHMGFRSRTFRSVMNAHNVRIHHTPPNAPTMNAVAERSHGVLLHGLRCALSLGRHQSVEAALPEVLYIMNSRERLGASPFSLMHCRLPRLPGLPDPDIHPKDSSDDLCPLPLSRAARLREKHTVRIQDVLARWEDYRDSLRGSHRGVRQFTVGDKVWVFSRSGGAAKLGTLYRGPFLVHAVSRMGAVVVLGTDKGYEVHAGSNCKLSLAAGDASTPYNPPFGDSSLDVKDFMQRATAAAK